MKRRTSTRPATVSRNMADAVDYLTTVASKAGLIAIAEQLTDIRSSLLRVSSQQEHANESGEHDQDSGNHEKQKFN
jgi:hypothetical protein